MLSPVNTTFVSHPHIFFFFFYLDDISSIMPKRKSKLKLQKLIVCSVAGHFRQLHDGKLYRGLFKSVFKALGRVGVGKGALELKSNSSST